MLFSRAVLYSQGSINSKIDYYNDLAEEYWHSNTKLAIQYSDSAYQLAQGSKYKEGLLRSLANKGISAYTNGDYMAAEDYYKRAIEIGKSEKIENDAFQFYLNLLLKKGEASKVVRLVDSAVVVENKAEVKIDYLLSRGFALVDLGDVNGVLNTLVSISNVQAADYRSNSILLLKAEYERLTGNYANAKEYLEANISTHKASGDSLNMAATLVKLAKVKSVNGNYDNALLDLTEAERLYKASGYDYGRGLCYYQLGGLYSELGQIDLSVEYYFKALEIFQDQNNKKELAETYYELAWMYFNQDEAKSRSLLRRAEIISDDIGNKSIKAVVYNYLGTLLTRQLKYDSAIYAYQKSAQLKRELNHKRGEAVAIFNLGYVYEKLGEDKKALENYLLTYPVDLDMGNQYGAAVSEYTIANVYIKLEQYKQAREYIEKAIERAEKLGAKSIIVECLLIKSKLYEKLGQVNVALDYYKRYSAMKDSVFSTEKEVRLAELEARYTLKQKDQEIRVLNLENLNRQQDLEIQSKTIKNQRFLLGLVTLGIVSICIVLFITFRLLKIRSRTNKQLQELNREISEKSEEITAQSEELREANEEILSLNEGLETEVERRTKQLNEAHKDLDTFFYHAAHDFRRPLTTFLGLAEIARTVVKDESALELFEKVEDTAGSLNRMVNKLKAVSIVGFDKLEFKKLDITKIIDTRIDKQEYLFKEYNVQIDTELQISEFKSSKDILEIIVDNLLENAILFSKKESINHIKISTRQKDKNIMLTVTDNGQGIDPALRDKVFELYFRGNETSQGNGLGLYITKKAVERLKGSIDFTSELGVGSRFVVTLPL
ncbi:tetratricopeptide repeat protein [Fulvivirga lutea]|uniref:histidine kinase n=1 Tax=Fulvivirga lutea TaxID=2810512 RepID=A0A974WHQ5_9BACT|nr:tetratricopeptide repeat protein [Fulvivirga lutea]QSE96320.1 tetratricopeptide repeat protein [Fulvivirga lutea]